MAPNGTCNGALYTRPVDPEEVSNGHLLDARFFEGQIQRSRRNLGLESLDDYLIEETELRIRRLGATAFRQRLRETFEMLESAVDRGWIGAYGLCTWQGLLLPHSEREHLGLFEIFELALGWQNEARRTNARRDPQIARPAPEAEQPETLCSISGRPWEGDI